MANEKVTERFKNLICSESEKNALHTYLFSCLAEGKSYQLKRNRVMIMESGNSNKFIILELVRTTDEKKMCYICPKCFPISYANFLSSTISAEHFKSCIHTRLCTLIWGDEYDISINVVDVEEEDDLVEVVEEKPKYMAVIHPSCKSPKGPGVVVLSSKMLKPKCIVCPGQDCCVHLKIHLLKYKRKMDKETNDSESKRLRVDRVEPKKPQKKDVIQPGEYDPFQYEGPEANVFNISIDFLQTKEMEIKNRKITADHRPFQMNILIAKYNPSEVCKLHKNRYDERENIIFTESTRIIIHHTKTVETVNKSVLYRPTVPKQDSSACDCKLFYTGKDDRLLRVSAAKNRITGRERSLHFVSYEFYFTFLAQLIMGGETMNAYIKSQKFMKELFFGHIKSPEYRKVLQKGFEIFCHALKFPEDANYCYDCPQKLAGGEKEDDFKEDVEYSIIDGLQMGCRSNEMKASIKDEYFIEEVVDSSIVKGIEAKDRTYLSRRKIRNIIGDLLSKVDDPDSLSNSIEALGEMNLDSNAQSVLEMLHRISSQTKNLPDGYILFLRELKLETPISALILPYSSNRALYKDFMDYLNNKINIFSSADILETFVNNFPVITECIKNILEVEKLKPHSNTPFLPSDVSLIIKNMIKLRFEFDKQSRSVAPPRNSPSAGFLEPLADFFPSYPIHTIENVYKADSRPDPSESDECEKEFGAATSISGGIGTLSCNHRITKGFRAIKKGESPVFFCHSILRRLPEKVKAHKRVVIYDFACKMHKVCLRRYPYRIRRFQFVIDRHHQSNHKACSEAYNISKYPAMSEVNTQIAEQLNNSLRKLATVVAYSNFQTYLRIIQIFISVKNLKIKDIV